MTQRVTDLAYLETQLNEVEQRLTQAVSLLKNLKTVQDQFKTLTAYYQDTRSKVEDAKATLADLQQQHEAALHALQTEHERASAAHNAFQAEHDAQAARHEDAHQHVVTQHEEAIAALEGRYGTVQQTFEHEFAAVRDDVQRRVAELEQRYGETQEAFTHAFHTVQTETRHQGDVLEDRYGAAQDKFTQDFQRLQAETQQQVVALEGRFGEVQVRVTQEFKQLLLDTSTQFEQVRGRVDRQADALALAQERLKEEVRGAIQAAGDHVSESRRLLQDEFTRLARQEDERLERWHVEIQYGQGRFENDQRLALRTLQESLKQQIATLSGDVGARLQTLGGGLHQVEGGLAQAISEGAARATELEASVAGRFGSVIKETNELGRNHVSLGTDVRALREQVMGLQQRQKTMTLVLAASLVIALVALAFSFLR